MRGISFSSTRTLYGPRYTIAFNMPPKPEFTSFLDAYPLRPHPKQAFVHQTAPTAVTSPPGLQNRPTNHANSNQNGPPTTTLRHHRSPAGPPRPSAEKPRTLAPEQPLQRWWTIRQQRTYEQARAPPPIVPPRRTCSDQRREPLDYNPIRAGGTGVTAFCGSVSTARVRSAAPAFNPATQPNQRRQHLAAPAAVVDTDQAASPHPPRRAVPTTHPHRPQPDPASGRRAPSPNTPTPTRGCIETTGSSPRACSAHCCVYGSSDSHHQHGPQRCVASG